MNRICDICGREEDEHHKIVYNSTIRMYLCQKHRAQFRRHGTITDSSQRTTAASNEYIIKDNYAELVIRNNKQEIIATAIIDIEDVEKCKPLKWHIGGSKGYIEGPKHIRLHRFIMSYDGPLQIDHINRNTFDNRKKNLRIVSGFINNQNNGATGVSFDKYAGKWKAEFQRFGKYFNVGTYDTKEEAIEARKNAIANIEHNAENLLNEYLSKDTNHVIGVRPSPHGRWVAKFCADGKTYHVGTFDTKEEAIAARQLAVEQHKNSQLSA